MQIQLPVSKSLIGILVLMFWTLNYIFILKSGTVYSIPQKLFLYHVPLPEKPHLLKGF